MTRHGTTRRLGVTVALALICCVYAGVASAKYSHVDAVVTEGAEAEAVAETSEPASAAHKNKKSAEPVAATSEPVSTAPETSAEPVAATSEPVSTAAETSAEPVAATSEPVSTAPETSAEPVAATSEPVSTAPETSAEPVAATSEPVSTAPETSAEPVAATSEPVSDAGVVATAEPLVNIPDVLILTNIPGVLVGSSLIPNSINVLPDVFSDLAAAASGDPRSAVRTDRRGDRDAPPANDDPSPLPGPGPQAPVPVAPAGASGASGGGSSGGFMALVALFLLVSLPFSRVVELSLTRMRTPRLVAVLARPD
jgi:hypothetical protein